MLSRRSVVISLERAFDRISGSIPLLPPIRPLLRALLKLLLSPVARGSKRPRSDGGGGVSILAGVVVLELVMSLTALLGGARVTVLSASIVILFEQCCG